MFTRHGHQIVNTTVDPRPEGLIVHRCGGPRWCNICREDVAAAQSKMTPGAVKVEDRPEMLSEGGFVSEAKHMVWDGFYGHRPELLETGLTCEKDVYVVWFAKTLQNWKAIVSTNIKDDMIYEVTYNGDKKETYLDAYHKVSNTVVPD